jgi:diaminohydroxyphosphoribosylaminopyrimidine deaminase/5-amino-6-(5-phosphoribosylamino)uracil reductase
MASAGEIDAMRRALSLASSTPNRTHPNPRVGAVVLDAAGTVVGEGFHRGAGHPHAEIEALSSAGERADGATVVVTLEPCHHTGRTPPCTEALTRAHVARVVYAQTDPNPVAKGGADALRAQGVSVEGGVLGAEAAVLNVVWSLAMRRHRPFVTWKPASTVDGRVAAPDGTSQWITGSEARRHVHQLRAEVDAVVVGTGTALVDDPHLTARDASEQLLENQPLRVVVGLRDLPRSARVLDDASDTVHLRTRSPDQVVRELFERGVHHALLEGGPTLSSAFVDAGLVDRVVGFLAPALLGNGPAIYQSDRATTLSKARRFTFDDVQLVGGDLRWTARLSDVPAIDLKGAG